jgi:threonine/homoserine/homoserine lactone efflux protein
VPYGCFGRLYFVFYQRKNQQNLITLDRLVTGFINHFINIEMVIFYIVVMSQLSSKNIATSLQFLLAVEMAVFTAIWFVLIAQFTVRIPNSEKVLNHIVTRIIFGALFLISAAALVNISRWTS